MHTRASVVEKARRSRTGCSNCRRQRIKCDEQYPTCHQCAKRQRHCNLVESRFRTYEPQSVAGLVSVGHAEELHDHSDPLTQLSEIESLDEGSGTAWPIGEDRPVTANAIPIPDAQSHDGQSKPASSGIAADPSVTSIDESTPFHRSVSVSASRRTDADNMSPEHIPELQAELHADPHKANTAEGWTSPIGEISTWTQSDAGRREAGVVRTFQTTLTTVRLNETQRESVTLHTAGLLTSKRRACLLRHFSSTPAKWMDLFDLDCFYSRHAPILALHSPLIMFSACALAAKQLSAVTSAPLESSARHISLLKGTCLLKDHHCCADYEWTATAYYDAAISLLLQHISDLATHQDQPASHLTENPSLSTCRHSDHATSVLRRESRNLKPHDEIVVAATILAIYEFLAGDAPTWSDHLDGARSFLRLSDEAGFLDFHLSPSVANVAPGPSGLLRAAFWNFARQDMLSALIHGKRMRLELDDFAMWRRMGVNLGPNGIFLTGDHSFHPDQSTDRPDNISNTLVWMLARIVNFIALGHDTSHTESTSSDSESSTYSRSWLRLKNELGLWFDALPLSFHPCSEVELPQRDTLDGYTDCQLHTRPRIDHETWYSESMCASTIQSYHMAEIFLLLHKPPEFPIHPLFSVPKSAPSAQGSSHDALAEFQQMSAILQYHAVEICAIGLSWPEEAARIHMLQPLYLAGRCLTDFSDRRIVVTLIDRIQDELGWHAKYRVEALLAEWGLTRAALHCYD